jgi:hypothetical protein
MSTVPNPAEAYASLTCACGRPKSAGYAFCATDMAALTIWQRRPLYAGPDSPAFAEAYAAALAHLQAIPTRAHIYAAGSWPYRDDDELAAAGYRLCEQDLHSYCRVPGCRARLRWYWTPANRKLALDYETLQPHRLTCADPTYFAQERAKREQQRLERKQQKAAARKPHRKAG